LFNSLYKIAENIKFLSMRISETVEDGEDQINPENVAVIAV
jgi:hypothetical protein